MATIRLPAAETAASKNKPMKSKPKSGKSHEPSEQYLKSAGEGVGRKLGKLVADKDAKAEDFFKKARALDKAVNNRAEFWHALSKAFFGVLKEKHELKDKAPVAAYQLAVERRVQRMAKAAKDDAGDGDKKGSSNDGGKKGNEKASPDAGKGGKEVSPKSPEAHEHASPIVMHTPVTPKERPVATALEAKAVIYDAAKAPERTSPERAAKAGQAAYGGLTHSIEGLDTATKDMARNPRETALDYAHAMATNAYGEKAADELMAKVPDIAEPPHVIVDDSIPHSAKVTIEPATGERKHAIVRVHPAEIERQVRASRHLSADPDDDEELEDDEDEELDDDDVIHHTSGMAGQIAMSSMTKMKGAMRMIQEWDEKGHLDFAKACGAIFLCTFAPIGVACAIGYGAYKATQGVRNMRKRFKEHVEEIEDERAEKEAAKQLEHHADKMAGELVYLSRYGSDRVIADRIDKLLKDHLLGDDQEFWEKLSERVAAKSKKRLVISGSVKPKRIGLALKAHLAKVSASNS